MSREKSFQLRGPTNEEIADIGEAAANIVIKTLRKDGHLAEESFETDRPEWVDKNFVNSKQLSTVVVASDAHHRR